MARFRGKIGFGEMVRDNYGVSTEQTVERHYTGDTIKLGVKIVGGENLNDNINLDNRVSIVADAFAVEKFHQIRYVEYHGVKWKVSSIEIQRPRLILTLGGLYNV